MRKILLLMMILICIKINAQTPNLQQVTTSGNITIDPIFVNGNGTACGVYVGHGKQFNLLAFSTQNGILSKNTAVGFKALGNSFDLNSLTNLDGSNSAFGYQTLQNVTTAQQSCAFGTNALANIMTGGRNCAFGFQALNSFVSGTDNSAFGSNALMKTTGGQNTALGSGSLANNIGGVGATAIGFEALSNSTANYNIGLGYQAAVLNNANPNQLSIGNTIYGINLYQSVAKIGIGRSIVTYSSTVLPGATVDVNGNLWIRNLNSTVGVNSTNSLSNYLFVDANGEVKKAALPNSSSLTNSCTAIGTLPRVADASGNLQCSQIYDDGTSVGIGQTSGFAYTSGAGLYNGLPTAPSVFTLSVNGWTSSTAFVALSDKRFKKNIQAIESPLSKILNIDGYTYNWNKNFSKSKKLDDNKQIGFLAQDLAKVIPEAVVINGDGVYGVNYNAVTPVIVEAMKEQQKQIEELKQTVAALQAKLNGDVKTTSVTLTENKLFQNTPNPFSSVTKIEYVVTGSNNNYIAISNIEGQQIKNIKLSNSGKGIIELNAGSLKSGTYTYSLYANGILVDTKLMVISK